MAHETEHPESWRSPAGILPPLIAAVLFGLFLQAVPEISGGGTLRFALPWVPSLGTELAFLIDGLSLTFALLISGIGVLVMLFAARYMAGHPQHGRFSLYLTSFMMAMLGLVLADDLISLFVFWELTTLTSYLLIGFTHTSAEARRAALQALLVTGTGGLAMLAGFLVIGSVTGTTELSAIRAQGDILRASPLYLPILVLILAGAFTKSAQVPFHFWLPNAMAAPTPVSAYLHSATMVKGGVYLLARFWPSLSGTDAWFWSLMIAGGVTTVFASIISMRQTDLKQTLAYTTLMALGALVLFLAAPNPYAVTAAVTFLVIHSFYKAALFLVIGCVDHACGTRDARRLGGLWRAMPLTALAAALAAASMAGLPPFLGFIGKELLYKGALDTGVPETFTAFIFAASALMFAVAGIVALKPFWGSAANMPDLNRPLREAPWQMLAGPLVLGALGLFFGLQPALLQHVVVDPTVAAVSGMADYAKELHLWAGVNTALYLSGATYLVGLVLYLVHVPLRSALDGLGKRLMSFDRLWDGVLAGLRSLAGGVTAILQSGDLNRYLLTVFAVIAAGLGLTALRSGFDLGPISFGDVEIKYIAIFLLALLGTALAVATRSRIAAIAGLGAVGIGVALVFLLFGAPDLAITQLLVEMLVVVLFAVAALRLPLLDQKSVRFRPLHAALATFVGGLVTAILLAATSRPLDLRLTEFFEKASYPEAHGRNVVNVILVDFRAFDTFGEISVVTVAALAAVALLRQRRGGDRT
ncbi:MAG: DUF4040 domain-containing protein [Rhodobacteraceae bacterium]|nr:DUF4040 domain-containing protein [Paracoccaceae bacterium]